MAFSNEDEARAALESLCENRFHLIPEVNLTHCVTGRRLRIDYIAAPMFDGFPMPFFGIEVKSGVGVKDDQADSAITKPICQCVDYNNSKICDDRMGGLNGYPVGTCFVFPGIDVRPHVDINRLAGGLRVGFMPVVDGVLYLNMCSHPIWSSDRGVRRPNFGKAKKIGSR